MRIKRAELRFSYLTALALWFVFGVYLLVDNGFGHPGRFGFGFGALIVCVFIYASIVLIAIFFLLASLVTVYVDGTGGYAGILLDVTIVVLTLWCHFLIGPI